MATSGLERIVSKPARRKKNSGTIIKIFKNNMYGRKRRGERKRIGMETKKQL